MADTLDHYEVQWHYATGNGIWFSGSSTTTKETNVTYNYPSNATKVKVTIKPVAKTYKSNNQDVPYWTGENEVKEQLISELPPDQLSAPSVTIEQYTLTAKIENIEDAKAEDVEFEVVKDDERFASGKTTVKTARASYSCKVVAGGKYRVRCRAMNYVGGTAVYGPWSNYSSETLAVPGIPTNVKVTVESKTSVKVSWNKQETATSYNIEYATNRNYFDSSNEVQSTTVENNYIILTGLEQGHEWYFRVAAVNSQGESGWSDIVYKIIGTKPEPPTTWSLTNTAIVGEPVTLYWVHNTEDGSKQNEAQIELTINGKAEIKTIDTSKDEVDEDETDKIYSYELDLSEYPDGAEVLWRIRTRGITFEYSDWSVQRTIDIYAPPTLTMKLGDESGTLGAFPYSIALTAGPATQTAISYHVNIKAMYTYTSQDAVGKDITINAGDDVFSKVYIVSENNFTLDLMPEMLTLENSQSYSVIVTVSMDSGLTATAEGQFIVSWSDSVHRPEASVVIDYRNLYAYITPYCVNLQEELVEDVALAVYRREPDGEFTEIATNVENYGTISVTDPHPALDYARYRVVARNKNTNVIGFTDIPAMPVGEPSIVIQWDEEWSNFDYISEEVAPEVPSWTGSMLKLPYNVDVSENYSPDIETVEYIGRKHPVGYYGTQKGSTATWNTVIPATDKETLYALRRLAAYSGNVYVREPSGTGYNAQITVSMSAKHLDLTIPVTFNITRVEGGI